MTPPPAFLPGRTHALLLRACLRDGDEARAAFAEWRAGVDLDAVDGATVRLLPLLATRLAALGIDDRQFGKYRGVQRLAWAQNHVLFAGLRSALGIMGAEVRPVLLKGIALAGTVYPQMSMRPVGDLDLLVPPEQAPRAIAALLGAGWRVMSDVPRARADFAVQHALTLRGPGGAGEVDVDLHWRLFHWRRSAAGEAALRDAALPGTGIFAGALLPGPADLLLHVLGHGATWNPLPPIRWVADATVILRRGGVDWAHLLRQARRFGTEQKAAATLGYLADGGWAEVPGNVLARLRAATPTRMDRLIFAMDQLPPEQQAPAALARVHLHRARTLVGASPRSLWRYAGSMRQGRSAGETLAWVLGRLRR